MTWIQITIACDKHGLIYSHLDGSKPCNEVRRFNVPPQDPKLAVAALKEVGLI